MTNNNSETTHSCGCKCLPYYDPVLITAQAVSIASVFFLWSNLITFFISLPAVILLQIVWCAPINKPGLITIGIFASVSAGSALVMGIYMLTDICPDSVGDNSYDPYDASYTLRPWCYPWWRGFLTLVGGLDMAFAAVCTFMFACGPRYGRYHRGDNHDDHKETTTKTEDDPEVGAIRAFPVVLPSNVQAGTDKKNRKKSKNDSVELLNMGSGKSKKVTMLPDGSIKTEIETICPDGSRLITTTIEKPKGEDDMEDVPMEEDDSSDGNSSTGV